MKPIIARFSMQEIEALAASCSNMVEGERLMHEAAALVGGDSEWKRNFCRTHLIRFKRSVCYKILMGEMTRNDRSYNYTPYPL